MKLCYNVQTCNENSSLQKDVELCAKTGFPAIEVSIKKAKDFLKMYSYREMTELLKKNHIVCTAVNAVFNINFCKGFKWERICKELEIAKKICEACEAEMIVVLSDDICEKNDTLDYDEIFNDTVLSLKKIVKWMNEGKKKIKIAFEPVGNLLVGNIKMASEIVSAVDSQDVGLVLDDFNLFLWDLLADVEDICDISPDRIFMVHLNDAENIPFRKISQMNRCMPGDGRIDIKKYMECVRATGYDGYVSIEVLNPDIWNKGPELVIPEAFQKLKKYVN